MTDNPLWVRVSRPHGHFTVPRAIAERGGWKPLKADAVDESGRPLPPKPRASIDEASKTPRRKSRRGDPTPKPKADAAGMSD